MTTLRGWVGSPLPPTITGGADQIGAAQTLDRDLELVEIHVQHPHPSECAP